MLQVGTNYTFSVFLKPVIEDMQWTRAEMSSASSVMSIVAGISSIIVGGVLTRFGPRRLVTIFGITLGIGYILMSFMGSLWQLYIFYSIIIGVSIGAPYVTQVSSITHWFVKRRGTMLGIAITGAGLGTIFFPTLVTQLIIHSSWRTAYLILGIILIVVMVLAARFMCLTPAEKHLRPYGEAAGSAAQVVPGPGSRQAILKAPQLWMTVLLQMCGGFCMALITMHIVAYATDLKIGFDAVLASNLMVAIGLTSIIGKLGMGVIVDRVNSRKAYMLSFGMLAGWFIWLLFTQSIWGLFLFAVGFGLAYGGTLVPQGTLVADIFGMRQHSLVMGIINFSVAAGSALGVFMGGFIFDLNDSYKPAFAIAIGCAGVGILLAFLLKPLKSVSGYGAQSDIRAE